MGDSWLHEIKLDGYRMHARIEDGRARLLTRTGLDWTDRYPEIAKALAPLPATNAYLDGELCAIGADGVTSFALLQAAGHDDAHLIYFAFDLLHLDDVTLMARPLRIAWRACSTGQVMCFASSITGKVTAR